MAVGQLATVISKKTNKQAKEGNKQRSHHFSSVLKDVFIIIFILVPDFFKVVTSLPENFACCKNTEKGFLCWSLFSAKFKKKVMFTKGSNFYMSFVVRTGLFLFRTGAKFTAAVTFCSSICAHLDNFLLPTAPSVSSHTTQV